MGFVNRDTGEKKKKQVNKRKQRAKDKHRALVNTTYTMNLNSLSLFSLLLGRTNGDLVSTLREGEEEAAAENLSLSLAISYG